MPFTNRVMWQYQSKLRSPPANVTDEPVNALEEVGSRDVEKEQ
jgi:hypothetical protein